MTDEVSVSFKVSITVMFAAGLLSSALGILVMGLQLLNGYSDKYHSTVSQATGGGISAIVAEGSAPMPLIYSAVDESINLIDVLILTEYDKSTDTYSGGYDEQTKTYWGSFRILYKYTQILQKKAIWYYLLSIGLVQHMLNLYKVLHIQECK